MMAQLGVACSALEESAQAAPVSHPQRGDQPPAAPGAQRQAPQQDPGQDGAIDLVDDSPDKVDDDDEPDQGDDKDDDDAQDAQDQADDPDQEDDEEARRARALLEPAPNAAEAARYSGPAPLKWVDLKRPAMVVRQSPSDKSDRLGSVRRGRAFPIFEYKEGRGCGEPWARVGERGWVCSDHFVDAAGPPGPTAPLPFKYGIVYEDTEIFRGPHRHMGTGKTRKRRSTVTILEETQRWVRTWPDQWLNRRVVGPREVRTARLRGMELDEDTQYPFTVVLRNHIEAVPEPDMDRRALRRLSEDQKVGVPRFTRGPLLGHHPKGARNYGQYIQLEDGWVKRWNVAVIEPKSRPRGIGEDEKWLHVDLSEQTAVAYEGDKPVYATIISSGKGKSGPESFTPTGKWRIHTKLRSSRMAGGSGASYHFLSDVPWVQYYHGGYALHGVYWHNGFGWPMSQGCINLTPYDAQWFFHWTGPHVPHGWYSVVQRDVGTWVVVTK